MLWDVIQAIAVAQHSLISRAQALDAGATDAWLRWAVLDGRLKRIRPGVYAIVGSASEFQSLMAACLAGGPATAASHMAAAALWGADQVKAGQLEVTTFGNRSRQLSGVVTHRSRLDSARAITYHRGLPVVVAPLTVVQVDEHAHPYLVKSVANDLVKRHWTSFPAILEWVNIVGDRRHQALRTLCLRAIDVGGHDNSPAARRLAEKLIGAGMGPFEIDYPVETPEGFLFIDLAWPTPKIGLEYNGARDHDGPVARGDDTRRRNRLVALGWRMLDAHRGFTHEQIIHWVRDALANANANASAS